MGGNAFRPDGLHTPRMPTDVYYRVLENTEQRLANLFQTATHAIGAPEKKDHGDLDILVAPLLGLLPSLKEVAERINAKRYFRASSNGIWHFAIPWPENESAQITGSAKWSGSESVRDTATPVAQAIDTSKRYIQVDITVCESKTDLNWRLFTHAHGDFGNIVASTIRHKGLILTSQALWLGIPGLDTSNKKLKRIELSRDPAQVLNFLGLDPEPFWRPFSSIEDMMKHIATCRFHDPSQLLNATLESRAVLTEVPLKSKHKSECDERTMRRYWNEVFLPAHENDPPQSAANMTQEDVEQEAFSFFGGDTKQRYYDTKREVSTRIAQEKLWAKLRAKIEEENPEMDHNDLHNTFRAVRREIVPPTAAKASDPGLNNIQKAYLNGDWATVKDWAATNYRTAVARWREKVATSRSGPHDLDARKANVFSTSEFETYTAEEDAIIVRMKTEENASWADILAYLGKKSKSQLKVHWKQRLQQT